MTRECKTWIPSEQDQDTFGSLIEHLGTLIQKMDQAVSTLPINRAPLQPTVSSLPWSEIMIDFVGPVTKSGRGYKYILVIVDLFSKYVEALPSRNMEAETVARLLVYHVFSRWGLPLKLKSDRGTHFTAGIIKELCKMLGIKHKFHMAWHPE